MVSYDSYKNRIIKLAAVKNFIVKFRALFIILIALIIAAITTLLVMKGMVFGELILPEQIVYGDSFEVEGANTFMSDMHYEYYPLGLKEQTAVAARKSTAADTPANDDEKWTRQKPDRAGKYLVRVVTDKSFGTRGYGKAVEFEIQPRDIDFVIMSTSVVYGAEPKYTFTLVNGDKLIATGLKYDYESFETTVTNVCANASSIKIVAPDGSDVTYCYNISTPQKEITFADREITLTPDSVTFTYDGGAVTYENEIDGVTQSLLSEGDNAVISTVILDKDGNEVAAPTAAGTYTVKVTDYKIYKGETDVTARYSVELMDASLEILRRPITVTTASQSREFNGEALFNESFEADGLPENAGHSVVAVSEAKSITFAGKQTNIFDFIVTDGEGNDLSENYIINCDFGTLEVTPRKITISSASDEKVYDGTFLSKTDGYEILREEGAALIAGHREELIWFKQISQVSQSNSKNELLFAILDGDGNDVSGNYEITYSYGTLTVTPRPLTITTGSAEKEYDGYALSCETAEFDGLADGEVAYVAEGAYITDVGEMENHPVYAVYGNNGVATDNYEIEYICGKLSVTPRNVIIKAIDGFYTYDGTEHSCSSVSVIHAVKDGDGFVADYNADGLVTFYHIPDVVDCATITDVGEKQNTLSVASIHEYGSERDVSANYNIVDYAYGTLTVFKRVLVIETQTSFDEEYDGAAHIYVEGWLADNLAPNQTLVPDESRMSEFSSVTDVLQEAIDNVAYYTVVNADGEDVSANYDVSYLWGKINLIPRDIIITTGSASKVYDGTPLQCLEGNADRLVDGHEIILDENYNPLFGSVTNVTDGEVENLLVFTVTDGERDVSFNYSIDYIYGTLSITQRAITVTTGTASKIYDGAFLYGSSVEPEIENIVEGEKYYAFSMVSILDVGTIDNDTRYLIYSGDEYSSQTDVTANYSVTYVWGTLTVTQRKLTITTGTAEKVYDGTPLYGNEAAAEADNIVEGEVIVAVEVSQITNVGVCLNETLYDVYSGEKRTTDNYDIEYNYGTLTVTARKITIYTANITKEYNGEPLTGDSAGENYVYSTDGGACEENYNSFYNLAMGEYCEPDTVASITEVGSIQNVTTFKIYLSLIDGEEVIETTSNYDITYAYGTLTVTKRAITVTTGTATHVYDRTPFSYTEDITADRLLEDEPFNHKLVVDEDRRGEFASVTYVTDGIVDNTVYVKVSDGNGKDISANYDISYVWGKISIEKREITVTTGSAEKEYDGTPLYGNGKAPEVLNIVEGEELKVDFIDSITDAGSKQNETTYKVFYGEAETTGNYTINYDYGTLTVTPREITVTTGTESNVYDGQPFTFAQYESVERLLSGEPFNHKLALDESKAIASVTYVTEGEVENKVYYFVTDADGNDISGNYHINYVWGKISITKRPITITTGSAEKEYDGTPLYGDSVDPVIENLADGERYSSDELTQITDVLMTDGVIGTVDNNTTYKFYSGSLETTENYTVAKYTAGKLKVTPRPITIETSDDEWVYDGVEHKLKGIDVIYTKADGSTEFGLVFEYHQVILSNVASICDVGTKENYCEASKILAGDYQTETTTYYIDVSDNYEIIGYTYGTLKVTPRPITVITLDKEWEYDGYEKSNPKIDSEYFGNSELFGLVEGHTANIKDGYSTIINAGNTPNELEVKSIFDGDRDVTFNYSIKGYINGTLTVTPREITVTTGTESNVYDGQPFTFAQYESVERLLDSEPFNHKLALDESKATASVTYVTQGEVENKVYYLVTDADGNDISGNYHINYVWGKISITKRPITITTGSNDKIYDGTPLYGDSIDPIVENIVSGQLPEPDAISEITDVGKVKNETTYKIYIKGEDDAEDIDVTANYEITDNHYGILEVTSCKLLITTGTGSREYDGTPYSLLDYDKEKTTGLAEGHSLEYDRTQSASYVTKVQDPIDNVIHFNVLDADGNDVSDNYDIDYAWGKISVTPRKIIITTPSAEHEYDGQPFSLTDGITADRLVTGHRVADDGTKQAVITNVGTVTNELSCKILNSSGEDVSSNYEITKESYIYGTLEVTPRTVTVKTASESRKYNGLKLVNIDYTVEKFIDGEAADGLVSGHKLIALGDDEISITNVGTVKNEYYFEVYDGKVNVSGNYSLDYEHGTLQILPREVAVTLKSFTDVIYDGTEFKYPTGANNFASIGGDGMAADEQLEVAVIFTDKNGNAVAPKNAGTYGIVLDTNNCKVIKGGVSGGASNYTVTQADVSTLSISKRQISVKLCNGDLVEDGNVYDGQAFVYPADWYSFTGGTSTADGETLSVGVTVRNSAGVSVNVIKDADEYTIDLSPALCKINGILPATDNYEITCDNSFTYKITKKHFTVTLEDVDYEYDGTVYNYPASKVNVKGLLDGVGLKCPLIYLDENGKSVSAKYAGTYTVKFDTDNWDVTNDKKSNYTPDPVDNVTLEISRRQIAVRVWFSYTDSGDYTKLNVEYTGEDVGIDVRSYESFKVKDGELTDGNGFVNGDDLTVIPEYTFTKNGAQCQPKEVGTYKVSIKFADSFINANYEIYYADATLEVVPRKVAVGANPIVGLEYDGGKFDKSLLSYYDYHYNNYPEEGFTNGENYDAVYTITKDGKRFNPNTDILYAGDYTVTVELSGVDSNLYSVDDYYEEMQFTVARRKITAMPDSDILEYNKTAYNVSRLLFDANNVYHNGTAGTGFVNGDINYAEVTYMFVGADRTQYTAPVNAGEYSIYVYNIGSNNGSSFIEDNYEFVQNTRNAGRLVITPITLIIAPLAQSKVFDGTPIELSADGYVILNEARLMDGDILTVSGSATLAPTVARTSVEIASYVIYDIYSGADMRGNYNVLHSYDANNELLSDYRISNFRAALSYEKRTIKVEQIIPEYLLGQELVYDGSAYLIKWSGDGNELFRAYSYAESGCDVEEQYYGLLDGHRLVVTSAMLGNRPDVNSKWLKLTVKDVHDNNLVWGYDIITEEKQETNITVKAIGLNVTVNADVSGMDDCILEEDQFTVEAYRGEILNGHFVQVSVVGGQIVITVQEVLNAGTVNERYRDRTSYYEINCIIDPDQEAGQNDNL